MSKFFIDLANTFMMYKFYIEIQTISSKPIFDIRSSDVPLMKSICQRKYNSNTQFIISIINYNNLILLISKFKMNVITIFNTPIQVNTRNLSGYNLGIFFFKLFYTIKLFLAPKFPEKIFLKRTE